MNQLLLPAVGFAIALFVVAIGGGGGVLYVGVLSSWLHVAPEIATATSLLATLLPTTIMGAYSHWREGNVNVRLGRPMLVAGMFGALGGSLLSDRLSPALYRRVLGAVLVYALLQIGRSFWKKWRRRGQVAAAVAAAPSAPQSALPRSKLIASGIYGFLGGAMSGLTGLSGSAPIAAGLLALGCAPLEVAGTSLFALTGLSAVGFFVHLGLGHVDGRLALLLCVGTLTGSAIGPRVLRLVPRRVLEAIVGPLLFLLILAMAISLLFVHSPAK